MKNQFKNECGSYYYEKFRDKSSELARLEHQSTFLLDLEIKRIQNIAGLKKDWHILDVGCGPGYFSVPFAKEVPDGRFVGLDPSEELLSVAREVNSKEGINNAEFVQGSIFDLSQFESQFDFVYSRFVFQHLDRPFDAIKQLISAAKPGGYVAILDIDFSWLSTYPENDMFEHLLDLTLKKHADPFVGHKLSGYLKQNGLTDIGVHLEPLLSQNIGGMDKFLGLLLPFFNMMITDDEMSETEREINMNQLYEDMIKLNYSSGMMAVFAAYGRTPI